jgi:hypothetical protein
VKQKLNRGRKHSKKKGKTGNKFGAFAKLILTASEAPYIS